MGFDRRVTSTTRKQGTSLLCERSFRACLSIFSSFFTSFMIDVILIMSVDSSVNSCYRLWDRSGIKNTLKNPKRLWWRNRSGLNPQARSRQVKLDYQSWRRCCRDRDAATTRYRGLLGDRLLQDLSLRYVLCRSSQIETEASIEYEDRCQHNTADSTSPAELTCLFVKPGPRADSNEER